MAWRRDHGGSNWKRRQDEWMEEDDLLEGDPNREQDLRAKLQRGSGDSTDRIPAEQVRAIPNIRPAGNFGNWKKGQGGRGFAARGGFGGRRGLGDLNLMVKEVDSLRRKKKSVAPNTLETVV
jgi:hypothetical protein